MPDYGNELDNIQLRSEKGRPLTVGELDNNFKYLRSFAATLDAENNISYALDNNEVFSFGSEGRFSLGTDFSGTSLVLQSTILEADNDAVLVVKNSAGQDLLEVMPNGIVKAPLGSFQIEASQLELDVADFAGLTFDNLKLNNYGTLESLEEDTSAQTSGTLAFAGGELYINK